MGNYIDNLKQADPKIAKRGLDYYKEDKVLIKKSSLLSFETVVLGQRPYECSLRFDRDKKLKEYRCSCPFPHFCKHIAASIWAIEEERKTKIPSDITSFLLKEIQDLSVRHDVVGYEREAYKILSLLSALKKEEALDVIFSYLAKTFENEELSLNPKNLLRTWGILTEKINLNEFDLKPFLDEFLSKCSAKTPYFFYKALNACLLIDSTSEIAQSFFLENHKIGEIVNFIEPSFLPKDMQPRFVLSLARCSRSLLKPNFLAEAKIRAKKENDISSFDKILEEMIRLGDYELLGWDDLYFLSLKDKEAARKKCVSLIKKTNDFSYYAALRSLYEEKEFKEVALSLKPFVSHKPYLKTLSLVNGEPYQDSKDAKFLLDVFPKDLYQAANYIKDPVSVSLLIRDSHLMIDKETKKKKRDLAYFYYLLILDLFGDDAVSYYLLSPEISSDGQDARCRHLYLFLLEKSSLLEQKGLHRYLGVDPCS